MRELRNNHTLVSYQTLRKSIGLLGLLIPALLIGTSWLASKTLPSSLSMYYYSNQRDMFVGLFCAMAVLLLIYRGHTRQKGQVLTDRSLSSLAALSVFGMVFLPVPFAGSDFSACLTGNLASLNQCGHYGFTGLFLLTMAAFSLILFRRVNTGKDIPPRRKRRNSLFLRMGVLILLPLILIAAYFSLPANIVALIAPYHPLLWLQSLALCAIGFGWLVKGGGLFWMNDRIVIETPKPDDQAEAKTKRKKERHAAAKLAKAAEIEKKPQQEILRPETSEQAA